MREMKDHIPGYGSDDKTVIALSQRLIRFVSTEFKKYKTPFGGVFKFGLSSPDYIMDADKIPATFDGRRNGDRLACTFRLPGNPDNGAFELRC